MINLKLERNLFLGPVHTCEHFFHKDIFQFGDIFEKIKIYFVLKCWTLFGLSNIFYVKLLHFIDRDQ